MAVSHHLRPGITDKSRVKILTVDPPTRTVQAAFKDGSMVHIAVWDVPHAFRWPQQGEEWIIRRDGGYWTLDHRQQQDKDESAHPIASMNPGELKLDSPVILDARGNRLATVIPLHATPSVAFSGSLALHRTRSGATLTTVVL